MQTCFFSFLCINSRKNMKVKVRYSLRCSGVKLQTDESKHVPRQLVCGCFFQEVSALRLQPPWVSPKTFASLWWSRPPRKDIRKPDTVSVLGVSANFQLTSFRKNFTLLENGLMSINSKVYLSCRWKCPATVFLRDTWLAEQSGLKYGPGDWQLSQLFCNQIPWLLLDQEVLFLLL